MRALLQDYYTYDRTDMAELSEQIQQIFAQKGSGFFSRIRHLRTYAMEEFDSILKKLNVHNPSSLQETFLALEKFGKTNLHPKRKERLAPILSSSPQLKAA